MRTPIRVRWWIFGYMFVFALLSYVQRTGVAVASGEMLPALHLSQMQLGWLNAAFTASYALFQIPGGLLGQRLGARWTYVVVGVLGVCATIMTPLAPFLLVGSALFVALLIAQCLLGASQAPIFPVFAAVIEAWFPSNRWAMANGLQTAGMLLGGAATPLLIVLLMQRWGWQIALFSVAVPVAIATAGWAWYGRNSPQEHWAVTADEFAEVPPQDEKQATVTFRRMRELLGSRDVLLLALSYLAMNYVFYLVSYWSFIYLVQVRHFSGIESGLAAMVPWLGAAVGATAGGFISDRLTAFLGPRRGYRLVPVVALPLVAVMLIVIIYSPSAYGAVASLLVVFFAVEINEGAYWAATMRIAREDTSAATGVLNTGGNLGGLICQPVVAFLSGNGQWSLVFISGAAFALFAALLWTRIDSGRLVKSGRNLSSVLELARHT